MVYIFKCSAEKVLKYAAFFPLFFQRVKTILSCICQQNVFVYIRYIFPRKQFDTLLVLAIKFWDPEIKLLTSFPIPDCPETYRDKQRHTQTHRPKDTHTHTHTHTYTHTHTQIHTLGSVLVYTFILGTLYIQIYLSKKKKNTIFYSPFFMLASVISEIDDLCYSVVHLS